MVSFLHWFISFCKSGVVKQIKKKPKMFRWPHSFIDSYYSVNPVWQNILKKKTPPRWFTWWKNHRKSCFRHKLDFVHVFTLSMLGHLVAMLGHLVIQKLGRKHHDEKSLDFVHVFHSLLLTSAQWHIMSLWAKNLLRFIGFQEITLKKCGV